MSATVETVIAENPPSDGRQWDCQCARCGSSMFSELCERCAGDGCTDIGELYEEDPLWYSPDDFEACPSCNGEGGWMFCMSADNSDWCKNNPIPGRENIEPSTPEWFTFDPPATQPPSQNAKG